MTSTHVLRRHLFLGLALAATASVAHAEADREALLGELRLFVIAIGDAEENGVHAADRFERPAADCDAVVAALTEAGMAPTDMVEMGEPFPFRQAGARCKEYGQWKAMVTAGTAVAEAAQNLAITASVTPGWGDVSYATNYARSATACTAAIDAAIAAGAKPDVVFDVPSNLPVKAFSLTTARTEVCAKLGVWAEQFGPATLAAKKAKEDAAKNRYAQHGAAGDRLSWLVHYDSDGTGYTFYVPGCKAMDDPKQLAKARVMNSWTSDDAGRVSLKRLQFDGNKLVSDTSRSFRDEPAAYASGCK